MGRFFSLVGLFFGLIGALLQISSRPAIAVTLDPEPAVCPLSSPIYKDLGAAAFGLEQRVLLPKGCEQLQSRLGEAAQQIRVAAEAIGQLKKTSNPGAP